MELTEGDRLELMVAPKGFGSENMSRIFMLTPASGREQVLECIVRAAKEAGSNPCPPMILGVGIGGDFELCACLAKRALCRPLDRPHPDPYYAEMERDALRLVNDCLLYTSSRRRHEAGRQGERSGGDAERGRRGRNLLLAHEKHH